MILTYAIYAIWCLISKKVYVGQTRRPLRKRWAAHITDSKRYDTHLGRAIKCYGRNAFTVYSLTENLPSKEEADKFEQFWIVTLHANIPECGYNMTVGGDNPPNHTGRVRSPETRKRMSLAKLGEKNPMVGHTNGGSFKSGKDNPNFGKPRTQASKDKLRRARLGHTVSKETRTRMSEAKQRRARGLGKRCPVCNTEDLSQFRKNRAKQDGLQTYCYKCHRIAMKK